MDWLDSPCSPRDSQESSPAPQFKSINSLVLSFPYRPTLTSVLTTVLKHLSWTWLVTLMALILSSVNYLSILLFNFICIFIIFFYPPIIRGKCTEWYRHLRKSPHVLSYSVAKKYILSSYTSESAPLGLPHASHAWWAKHLLGVQFQYLFCK